MAEAVAKAGLEGVVAADSSICYIDGDAGILSYRGYNIHTLAENATFEETAYLLWFGRLPKRAELEELQQKLAAARGLPAAVMDFLRALPPKTVPMHMLRTAVSALSIYDPDAEDMSEQANIRKSIRLTAQMGTVVAAFARLRDGKQPVDPDPALSYAANFLYMLNGTRPAEVSAKTLDIALILHADHEFNASTFAGRVTAGTLADLHSATTSALGALKGPLHGGANEAVMKILAPIGSADEAVAHVREMLAAKKKVPGFGHRVYRTEDPRATHLRRMSEALGRQHNDPKWFEMSRAIEQLVNSEKRLNANVDFYSASTYHVLGIPIDLFTPVFAMSRITGWTAHFLEQYANNRLIRPRSDYVGPPVGQPWVPIEQR